MVSFDDFFIEVFLIRKWYIWVLFLISKEDGFFGLSEENVKNMELFVMIKFLFFFVLE